MKDLKRIDHIAVVVEDLDQALTFWRDWLGLLLSHTDTVESMQVRIAFLPLGERAKLNWCSPPTINPVSPAISASRDRDCTTSALRWKIFLES